MVGHYTGRKHAQSSPTFADSAISHLLLLYPLWKTMMFGNRQTRFRLCDIMYEWYYVGTIQKRRRNPKRRLGVFDSLGRFAKPLGHERYIHRIDRRNPIKNHNYNVRCKYLIPFNSLNKDMLYTHLLCSGPGHWLFAPRASYPNSSIIHPRTSPYPCTC